MRDEDGGGSKPDPEELDETLFSGSGGETGPDEDTISAARPAGSHPSLEGGVGTIGRYQVLGKLGEGGMGVVYEAQQQDPRRVVALKVIRGGSFVDDDRVRMFEREVETLARLNHPNIGAIYESGRTEDGQHFFAMELVRGQNLDAYLAGRPAPHAPGELDHRLRLFARIASAVHYAHQRGVIHRDLKPSNIIVTAHEQSASASSASSSSMTGLPQIKILDFGLARITDEDVVAASMITEIGVIKGTLPYMSPEQARGDAAAIDLRTDVYALGVLLYEMIGGRRPYDVEKASILEAVRVICEEPPQSLRTSWSGRRRLDADLETIAGKALQKEPERRYGSAAAFADDVTRFLASEPILARPPSAVYQMKKFAQRHRPIVAGASVALVALLAGIVVSTTLYLRAEREAERARIEASNSEQVGAFLQDMLAGVGPSVAQGRDTTLLREILERADERIEEELLDSPAIEAHIRSTLGTTYFELNDFEKTRAQYDRALELYVQTFGEENADVAQMHSNLGLLDSKLSNYEPAIEHLEKAVDVARRVHGEEGAKTGEYRTHLGNAMVEQGRYKESLVHLQGALESLRALHGEDHMDVGVAYNSVANVYHYLGQHDDAKVHYDKALEIHRRVLGDKHPFVAIDLMNLAYLAKSSGDVPEAERLFRDVLTRQRELYPDGDEAILHSLAGLSNALEWSGRYEESEELRLEGVELARRLFGDVSEAVSRQLNGLGVFYDLTGQTRRSLEAYEQALAINREVLGEKHPQYAVSLNNVGMARSELGDSKQAIEMVSRAAELYESFYGPDAGDTTLTLNNLARIYRASGDDVRSEAAFRDVIERRIRGNGEDHVATGVSKIGLARLLAGRGEHEEALDLARDAVRVFEAALGPDHFQSRRVQLVLGDVLRKVEKLEDSEQLLRSLRARAVEEQGDASEDALRAGAALARTLADQGRGEEVDGLYRAALDAGPKTFTAKERAGIWLSYGKALRTLGRMDAARGAFQEAHEIYVGIAGERSPDARKAAEALAGLGAR